MCTQNFDVQWSLMAAMAMATKSENLFHRILVSAWTFNESDEHARMFSSASYRTKPV